MPVLIDNLQDYVRRNNIFGAPSAATPPPAPVQNVPTEPSFIDRYRQHIQAMPQQQNPGMLRKILAAAAAGLSNLRSPQNAYPTYDMLANAPYHNALSKWEMEGKALQPLMQAENIEGKQQATAESQRLREESINSRAEIAQSKIELEKAKFERDKILKDMSDSQKMQQAQKDRLDLLEKQIAGREKEEAGKQTNRVINREDTQAHQREQQSGRIAATQTNIKTRETNIRERPAKPTSSGASTSVAKPESEDERRKRVFNNASEFAKRNPELGKYIHVDTPTKNVKIDPPGTGASAFPAIYGGAGLSQEDYNKIVTAVHGSSKTAPTNSGPPKNPKVGDTYKYPNGKVGKFDGQGWVMQ